MRGLPTFYPDGPSHPARANATLPGRVLQSGLLLGRGHPRPLTSPGSWAACSGKTTLPRDPREQRKPLALTAAATSLSASPACLGAGSWELDYGGLTCKRSRRSSEPLPFLPLLTCQEDRESSHC